MSDLYHFLNSLRDLTRPRKLVAPVLLIGLTTLLALIVRYNTPSEEYHPNNIYNLLSSVLIFRFILVILSVVFITGVIAQEIEQKTISYLLTRPIPRWRILFPKFLASVLVTIITVSLSALSAALVAYGPGKLGQSDLGRDLLIIPVGVCAYCALFLLISTLLNRPLILGLLYAFGYEPIVSSLPGDWSKFSLMSYLLTLAPHLNSAASEAGTADPGPISKPLAWGVLLGVIVVSLIGAMLVFSVREYVPREDSA